MTTFLTQEMKDALAMAQRATQRKKSRLRVEDDGRSFAVLRLWENGFALDADDRANLRGHVNLFDGARHVMQCLIVASEEFEGERRFEFKRSTVVSDTPALDFAPEQGAPVGLIGYTA